MRGKMNEQPIEQASTLAATASDFEKAPGHWVLARMGKRVLRPGGRELTEKLVSMLRITPEDDVVEFAPGLGFTARLVLQHNPRSYIGIEQDVAAANETRLILNSPSRQIVNSDVLRNGLEENCASLVYGEAMLTMQSDAQKNRIAQECKRLLRQGGRYGIHELCLKPDSISESLKKEIQRELAQAIRVNARPLTVTEWKSLLTDSGLEVESVNTNPMHLLRLSRIVTDEGFLRALKIATNVLTTPAALKRILAMRAVFERYAEYLGAIAIVAVKK